MKVQNTRMPHDTREHILEVAIPLFAAQGYSKVSMRILAKSVGISGASIYHHFPDKQSLYLDAISLAFTDTAKAIEIAFNQAGNPADRLEEFVTSFTELMGNDLDFRKLLHRELLDGDDVRLKLLAERLFIDPFKQVMLLADDIFITSNSHMMAISIFGLVLFHYETERLRLFLPNSHSEHDQASTISAHVMQLLTESKAFKY